jgi:transposase InsO family protein
MCEVLGISRAGFYKWRKSEGSERRKRHQKLLDLIRKIFEESRQTYGYRRVTRKLRKLGVTVNKKLVQKLMAKHALKPKRKRRFKLTTDSKHNLPISKNRLKRRFVTNKPNQVWVGDITYIETKEGWLYLSVWIDLHSRKVVGWSMSERMTADIVTSAFKMARDRRGTVPEMVHSDRGSQYASATFRKLLKKCKQSMSGKGNCWDNAVAESFFGVLKSELIHRTSFETREDAAMSIFDFIEIFYNRDRLHSTLGYVSPMEFEDKSKTAA